MRTVRRWREYSRTGEVRAMSIIQRRSIAVALLIAASLSALVRAEPSEAGRSFKTWSQYLGGADSSQYSSLDQINKSTVSQLEVAWRYPSGDTRSYRFNPIVIDGTMFVLAKNNSIVAVDAVTGQEKWSHPNDGAVGDRGINYWESRDRSDRRLLYLNAGSADGYRRANRRGDSLVRGSGPR